MKSRPVDFTFAGVSTYWAENKEFALIYNGASLVDPPLEIYLCRCMQKAKELLPPHMHEDIQVFIQQESTHYRGHNQFNKAVAWSAVDTKPLERDLARDYERFLKNRSLRFNLAYCEGFESTSVIPMDFLQRISSAVEGQPSEGRGHVEVAFCRGTRAPQFRTRCLRHPLWSGTSSMALPCRRTLVLRASHVQICVCLCGPSAVPV